MSLNWQDIQKCLCSSRWRTVRKISNFRFPERGVALPPAIHPVISEPIEYILKRVCPCWISFKLVKALGCPHQNGLSKLLDPKAEYIPLIYSPMIKLENKHCLRPDDWLNFPLPLLFPSLTNQKLLSPFLAVPTPLPALLLDHFWRHNKWLSSDYFWMRAIIIMRLKSKFREDTCLIQKPVCLCMMWKVYREDINCIFSFHFTWKLSLLG